VPAKLRQLRRKIKCGQSNIWVMRFTGYALHKPGLGFYPQMPQMIADKKKQSAKKQSA
jgi:hypothetical protein